MTHAVAAIASPKKDKQIVEIVGRNLLVSELLGAGLEVAFPIRDHGIDLIAFADTGPDISEFRACPIQMKAASKESFGIHSKYSMFPGLLIAFVWHVWDPKRSAIYCLTHFETVSVADQMGFTHTKAWADGKFVCNTIGSRLRSLLEPYQMTPEKWRTKVAHVAELLPKIKGTSPSGAPARDTPIDNTAH